MYVHYLSGEADSTHVKQVANAEKDRQVSLLPLYIAAAVVLLYASFVVVRSSFVELKGRNIITFIRTSRKKKTNQVENIPMHNEDVQKSSGSPNIVSVYIWEVLLHSAWRFLVYFCLFYTQCMYTVFNLL